MQYKTFRRICTALLISLALCLEVKAQNIPIYGNLVPSDSGALDLGSPSLHWDTIFVDAIYPPVSGAGIWTEVNDSTAIFIFGGDTFMVGISAGSVFAGNYETGAIIRFNEDISMSYEGTGINTFAGSNAGQAIIRLREDSNNGTNYVQLQPPASVAANYTLTFPDDDGNGTQYLTGNGSGVLSWSSASAISPFVENVSGRVVLVDSTDNVSIGFNGAAGNKLYVLGTFGVTTIASNDTASISTNTGRFFSDVKGSSGIETQIINTDGEINFNYEGITKLKVASQITTRADIRPNTDGADDIGTASLFYDSLYINNIVYGDTLAPAAEIGTLTNFPTGTAGDPTGFIEIEINGVIRKMPYW